MAGGPTRLFNQAGQTHGQPRQVQLEPVAWPRQLRMSPRPVRWGAWASVASWSWIPKSRRTTAAAMSKGV